MRLRAVAYLCALTVAGPLSAQAEIVGYQSVLWGTTRAELIRQRGEPMLETSDGLGAGMTELLYSEEPGTLAYTVSQQSGVIRIARSHEFVDTRECAGAFEGLYSSLRTMFPAFAPEGRRVNTGGTDLCAAVLSGAGTAKYTWTDPANDATITIQVIPGTSRLYMVAATPEYRRWQTTGSTTAGPAPGGGGRAARLAPGHLTVADAVRVGFERTEPKGAAYAGAVEAAGGLMGGQLVEIYAYAGEIPASRVAEFQGYAGSDKPFGWKGVCIVRNVMMLYRAESACTALRTLERR